MTKRVIVEDLARAELRQAMRWYEEQRPGKGAELLDEVDGIFVALSSPTTIGVTVPGVKAGVRLLRILLTRFPYAVVYVEHEERVHVVAVAHLKKEARLPDRKRRDAPDRDERTSVAKRLAVLQGLAGATADPRTAVSGAGWLGRRRQRRWLVPGALKPEASKVGARA
jgi:plasmid stabilization system protein ParE